MPEEIVTHDRLQRRFQYRITAPMVHEHLSTLDVIDLGDGTSLVVYSADANPSTMALDHRAAPPATRSSTCAP